MRSSQWGRRGYSPQSWVRTCHFACMLKICLEAGKRARRSRLNISFAGHCQCTQKPEALVVKPTDR